MRGVTHISFVSPVSLDYRNISGKDSYLKGITKHQYITVCILCMHHHLVTKTEVVRFLIKCYFFFINIETILNIHTQNKTSIFILDNLKKIKTPTIFLLNSYILIPSYHFKNSFSDPLKLICILTAVYRHMIKSHILGRHLHKNHLVIDLEFSYINQDTNWSIEVAKTLNMAQNFPISNMRLVSYAYLVAIICNYSTQCRSVTSMRK